MSNPAHNQDAAAGDFDLVLTRLLDAPREALFRCWATPALIERWFAPAPLTTTVEQFDLRPGGASIVTMRDPAGNVYPGNGVYLEIVPNERLVFTFKWAHEGAIETLVTVTWREEGGRTRQSFHQTPFTSVEERDSHVGGWTECLDKEKAYVETLAGTEAA